MCVILCIYNLMLCKNKLRKESEYTRIIKVLYIFYQNAAYKIINGILSRNQTQIINRQIIGRLKYFILCTINFEFYNSSIILNISYSFFSEFNDVREAFQKSMSSRRTIHIQHSS